MNSSTPRSGPLRATNIQQLGQNVRRLARKSWNQDFTGAMRIRQFRPKYEVPGRRGDGSIVGKNRIRWALRRMWLPIRDATLSLFGTLIVLPISLLNSDVDFALVTSFRKGLVTGPQNGQALGFADANKGDQHKTRVPDLWLLWSHQNVVLARIHDIEGTPRLESIWEANGGQRPDINAAQTVLVWPDRSIVQLAEATSC